MSYLFGEFGGANNIQIILEKMKMIEAFAFKQQRKQVLFAHSLIMFLYITVSINRILEMAVPSKKVSRS